MANLAIFDLDHTLIQTDSDNAWGVFLIEKGFLDKEIAEAKNAQFYQDYQNGCLNVLDFVAFQVEPMRTLSPEQLNILHQEFTEKYILPYMTETAQKTVQNHRDAGDELLVISSTNEFIITPICHLFGIENVIGTRLETDERGYFTGKVVGTPSLREGKITRLNEWLAERGQVLADFDETYFYSDSKNDLPLLSVVSQPVAVNPDAVLLQHAQEHHWKIMDFS